MAPGDEPPPKSQPQPQPQAPAQTPSSTATPALQNKSPPLTASPSQSRESSPSRSPALLQSNDSKSKPNSGSLSPIGRATSASATAAINKIPKPLSLGEAATKILNTDNQDTSGVTAPSGSGTATANGSSATANGSSMRWPTSPRIRSPPASAGSRRNSASSLAKLSDPDNIDPDATPTQPTRSASIPSEQQHKSPVIAPQANALKVPRGFSGITSTLETVQEGDNSSSPTDKGKLSANRPKPPEKQPSNMTTSTGPEGSTDFTDSETDGTRAKELTKNDVPPAGTATAPNTRKNLLQPPSTQARPTTDGSSKNMIVETETVASIPQSAAPSTASERNANGKKEEGNTVGPKPSREMLKPKKDKKKPTAKRPIVMSGPMSSKADIFEARVASAAEDEDTDSDENFVYESTTPHEPRPRPRHHSRTPSANSVHSLVDHRRPTNRPVGNLVDGQRSMRHKRSMKFASNSQAADEENGDREFGTVRSHRSKKSPSQSSQHPHVHGLSHGSSNQQGESESSSLKATKMRNPSSAPGSRHSSKPNTPHSRSPPPYSQMTQKGSGSLFDFDRSRSMSERDPLLGAFGARSTRTTYGKLHDSQRRCKSLRAYSGCCCICFIMVVVLAIAGGFLFATTHPLYEVMILDVQNVLATEESLMADLLCTAINPNIVPISISDMDVNIFAKSRHVSQDAEPQGKQRGRHQRPAVLRSRADRNGIHALDSVDDGTDPITDPHTMLLGRVLHFDSSLSFEATPLQQYAQNSTGELRINKPGNSTEEDGSERWENVIQHPFKLIVRGVFKYSLPLSSRIITSSVSKTVDVDADDAGDELGRVRTRL